MSDLNDPLKESYIAQVAVALKPYATELTTLGFDPTARIAELTGAGPQIEVARKAHTEADEALAAAIRAEQKLRNTYYTMAANTVSLVEGLLGKNHALPAKLRSLRADLIGNQNPSGNGTAAPAALKPA